MCERLALSFNKKVNAQVSFTGFRKRGNENPDGWGFAFFPDKAALIFKEPKNAADSKLSDFIRNYPWIESNTFIAHVRRASKGDQEFCNTHPFSRELFDREYIFAHNGTLENFEALSLTYFKPIGETDSEHAFCYILSNIKEKEIRIWDRKNFNWLKNLLSEINELGSFNCIMSDGSHLFCYYDNSGYNGLHFTHRKLHFKKYK
jgi:glutamine amidotransferase